MPENCYLKICICVLWFILVVLECKRLKKEDCPVFEARLRLYSEFQGSLGHFYIYISKEGEKEEMEEDTKGGGEGWRRETEARVAGDRRN